MRALCLLGVLGCGEPIRDFLVPVVHQGTANTHTLFLNFDEVTMHGGLDEATVNSTPLLQNQTRFTAYAATDPNRASMIDAVTTDVEDVLAPYDILVTTARPASGPYVMIVFTDDAGNATGCPNCISFSSMACNTELSPVGFMFGGVFGGGQFTPVHLASSNAIAMFGIFAAIPTTSSPGDCMCYAETPCIDKQMSLTTACSIGGAGTPVSVVSACPTTETTIDETAAFLDAFGPPL